MAKTKIIPHETEIKVVVTKPAEVVLTLTVEEAAALRVLLGGMCLRDMEPARNVYRVLAEEVFGDASFLNPYEGNGIPFAKTGYNLKPVIDRFQG